METWGIMDSVDIMEKFILSEMIRLESVPHNPRVKRQLSDGENFIEMLHSKPFCDAKRVGQLRKIISQRRTYLKDVVKDISKLLPNHQVSLFDEEKPIPENNLEKLSTQKNIIEEEIRWLHKALGICSNKNYFK